MVFGWQISPEIQWALWVGLMAFFCICFYSGCRSVRGGIQQYENAWWNQSIPIWVFLTLGLGFVLAPILAGSLLSFFFADVVTPQGLTNFVDDWAFDSPILLLCVRLLTFFIMSFVFLVGYLAGNALPRQFWIAEHFNFSLAIFTLLFVAVQTFGVFLDNFIATR